MSSIVAIGVTHRSAPLELLERMSIDAARMPKYLDDLTSRENVSEATIISTCNRTEIVVAAEKFHGAFRDVRDFLSDLTFLPPEDFADHLVVSYEAEAANHVFAIASGLDSVVVGEHEILGQIRDAWELARTNGSTGQTLNLLFRHAIEVGKRARSETSIGRNVTSVSHASVILAGQRLGSLENKNVLVVGAGSMARGVCDFVAQAGASRLTIANRTVGANRAVHPEATAVVPLSSLNEAMSEADVVFCATAAPGALLDTEDVQSVLDGRGGSELLFVDIAVPRDVSPGVAQIEGVTVLDMDDIRVFSEGGLAERRNEVPAVREIVEVELARYRSAASAREAAPLIKKLHGTAAEVVADELSRFSTKLDQLDDAQRDDVEALVRGVVSKLLHQPTISVKNSAGTIKGERLATALSELFDL